MGLTIHYSFKAPGSKVRARQLVHALHQAARDLPFKRLGPVTELSGAQCDPDGHRREDPLRWLLIQAAQSVEFKPKGRGQDQGYSSWFDVPPTRLIAFFAWPGEGCEASNFGLCQYPAVMADPPLARSRPSCRAGDGVRFARRNTPAIPSVAECLTSSNAT